MNKQFTICVLLYGDYPELAQRCLGSIINGLGPPGDAYDLRLGDNAISDRTAQAVGGICRDFYNFRRYRSQENIHKYPMMRRMLYDTAAPITTPYVMWFDDDSSLTGAASTWLDEVAKKMETAAVLGAIYHQRWQGEQREWVKAQPWYGGSDPAPRPRINFPQGAWWCARTEILHRFNYPWPELDHRGGDVMLGELLHQQKLLLVNFRTNLWINADERGRESEGPRRGFDSKPIGFYGSAPVAVHPPVLQPYGPLIEL